MFLLLLAAIPKRRVWPEDAGGSWGSDRLLRSRRRTRVLALERDGVPLVHGEVAGVEQTPLQHSKQAHTCTAQYEALFLSLQASSFESPINL